MAWGWPVLAVVAGASAAVLTVWGIIAAWDKGRDPRPPEKKR